MTIYTSRSRRSARLPRLCLVFLMGSALLPGRSGAQEPAPPPVLFENARIIDGTGAPEYRGDLLIRDGGIVAMGAVGSVTAPPGTVRRDLDGLVLAPGFIDIHNHSAAGIFEDPLATTQIAQGITTLVVGADGGSPWPVERYLSRIDSAGPAVNVATLVGHGTVRRAVMGDDYRRTATDAEIADMATRVEMGMLAGAFGLSSGLEYDPGFYSSTGELVALARAAADHGGFYMSHMRDEEEGLLAAVDEAIRIGREAGLPVQISHIKAGNASVWGKAHEVLAKIGAANDAGLDVLADQYPYSAWQSGLAIVVRSRMFQDPDSVAAGIAAAGGGSRLQIVNFEAEPEFNGMRLSEIAEQKEMTETEAYIWIMTSGGSGLIGHTMNDDDVDSFMASPFVMTASDGGIGFAHPRGAGTFPRVLGHYVRERGVLTLERAVQRGTSMPARRLGLTDRGALRAGAHADLVIFDPSTIIDQSTFVDGQRLPIGIESVWVGGLEVWADDGPTGARTGRALRRAG